jgi:hypothetical protein
MIWTWPGGQAKVEIEVEVDNPRTGTETVTEKSTRSERRQRDGARPRRGQIQAHSCIVRTQAA